MSTIKTQYTVTQGDVSNPVFSYSNIELFPNTTVTHASQLQVLLNGNPLVFPTDYTVNAPATQVSIVAGLTAGDTLTIRRSTSLEDRLVDWEEGGVISESQLDTSDKQWWYALQEIQDTTATLITLNPQGTAWDGLGRTTQNFTPATTADGLPTLGQVQNLIAGAEIATVDNVVAWVFTGNGATSTYQLVNAPVSLNAARELFVYLDGVAQRPDTAYTLNTSSSPPSIVFSQNLPNGAVADVRVVSGNVAALLSSESIGTEQLADLSVTPEKLKADPGAANRVFLIDTAGGVAAGTLLPAAVSGFDTQVRTSRLDQMAVPTNNVSLNNRKITNLQSGSSSLDAVNFGQMNAAIASAVAVATSAQVSKGTLVAGGSVALGFVPDLVLVMSLGTADASMRMLIANGSVSVIEGPDVTVSLSGTTLSSSGGTSVIYFAAKF